MSNIFNDDFRDFIQAMNNHDVEYILVGGYAVILHGYRRATGDMDIWVNRTKENYSKITSAFAEFGLPVFDMTLQKFLDADTTDVFSYGRPPISIDALTQAQFFNEGELKIRFIHLYNLIQAKKAAGRHKDLDDIEKLTSDD